MLYYCPKCEVETERFRSARGSHGACKRCQATARSTEEHKVVRRAYRKKRYPQDREIILARHRESQYGLVAGQFAVMLRVQAGRCAICRQMPSAESRGLHVDHDHSCCTSHAKSCGKCVRALLCDKCNTGLGKFRDSPELLRRAAGYLEEHAAWLRC